jgi:phosphoribosylamine--glycine ligase
MNVLVIGSGGREHALVSAFNRSPRKPRVHCAPGNAGVQAEATTVDISPDGPDGIERLLLHARKERIDLTLVGPEAPLVLGIVDRFEAEGLKIFGPNRSAARLEGSKCFTKEFLARQGIPTASFQSFDDAAKARAHVEKRALPLVVKADGLAAGKGVILAGSREEAIQAIDAMLLERRFGDAGKRVVIEDCLEGSELSFLIVTDGESYVPLETAQDYKRIFDSDRGPNTGGMGCYSPRCSLNDPLIREIGDRVIRPTLEGLRREDIRFRGVLYVGLMLTKTGPQVLEFNVRLGDPETQAILVRLRSDWVELLERAMAGNLGGYEPSWDPRPSVCVIGASAGYPGSYRTGHAISGLETVQDADVHVFHAGTKVGPGGEVLTAGGRVLAVTALGKDLRQAREKTYAAISKIRFEGMQYRLDIGR